MRFLTVVLLAVPMWGARPQGPCDIYGAAGTPCVAAHSTTRALSAAYNGPLYQVKRTSDGRTLDIGIVAEAGYANSAAQDAFCANTMCVINVIYDQSGKKNHLYQAPPGPLFPGPSKGAFDTQPIADMAPVTLGGHRVYGVFIMPGMGMRNNDATGLAINDEAEGIYYVVNGKHFDSGCCFDYGNASTNGRAVGTGTMETTYFGTSTVWGRGNGPGPWIMSDLEAGLFSGYDAKLNTPDPTIDSWRFVTAVMDGGGGNKWDLRGGDAQKGGLTTYYSGVRPGSRTNNAYFPMHKQGAILLGTGGDNGNGSSGTFYEGVMTSGYPTEATTDAVQANIVAAKYDVQRVAMSRLTTFTPGAKQDVTVTFTNTSGEAVKGVRLSAAGPKGWTAAVSAGSSATFAEVAAGASVTAKFTVTAPGATGAGFMTARADWKGAGGKAVSESLPSRVRNVFPVKVNEVKLGTTANAADQFVELFNASKDAVDISGWRVINTQSQWAPVTLATVPAGTKLAAGGFYLLGLASSGLANAAEAGASVIEVRSTAGFSAGQTVDVEGETRTVKAVGSAASPMTLVFEPVSTGPWMRIPAGATKLPVASAAGFEVGQKIGIDLGGKYEVATVTAVGKAATQTTLSAAVKAGETRIKLAAAGNVLAGDALTIGTGARKETATVKSVGSDGVELAAGLQFDHAQSIDVSDPGTGISFTPATKFEHVSGDAVQALGSGLTLDRPLAKRHAYGAPVVNAAAKPGYEGGPAPQQWFGGMLSARAGSLALMDATGSVVVDAVVYGSQQSNSSANGTIASPELATLEGEQGQGGCIVVAPLAAGGEGRSRGRFPDGADADNLCQDFKVQAYANTAAVAAGESNIKVDSVAGFAVGQQVVIDTGANQENAEIATIGTSGGTVSGAAVAEGATVIPVGISLGFSVGQTITIDAGAKAETVTISAVQGGRGGARITVGAPLKMAHAAGVPVAGSGITLRGKLGKAHAAGTRVAAGVPTPGAANRY